jgi:protocatechuate 3,4-dioxygenase beta subunit
MKNAMMLACLLASAPTLFGQTAASSVGGQVVNAATGAPVKRATVSLRLSRSLPVAAGQTAPVFGANTVETDDQGRFAFRNVTPGGYLINAQRQGFLDPSQGQISRPTAVLMVGENQQVTGVVVRLTPHSVISGKVLDADGEPLAGVQVAALRWAYVKGKRQLARAATGSMIATNDLGEYRIAGLAAGNYFVMAGTHRADTAYYYPDRQPQQTPELAYANTYYPAATDPAMATPVRAPAGGEVRGIDIKLIKTKTVSIRGQVIDPGATANRPVMVSLVPRLGAGGFVLSSAGYAVALAGGAFQISGVPPGSYYLVTRRITEQGQIAAGGSLGIEVGDKSLDGITVQVSPVVDVEGILISEPAGRCGSGYVSLVDESGFSGAPGANISAGSKFTLKNVVPSTYTLNLMNTGACYLQSVRFAGRDLTDMRVKVDGSGPMEINLAASEAAAEGTVTDSAGKPVNNAIVTFVPKDGAPSGFRTAPTNRTGFFIASGMRPGAYDVFAWESVDYSAAQSPEYVKQFASRAKSITVEAAGRQTIQLTAIPASATGESAPPPALLTAKGSVEGQVVNTITGAPLSSVKVTLGTQRIVRSQAGMLGAAARVGGSLGGQTPPPGATVETDEQGRFAIRDIEPDIYFIAAERQGFSAAGSPDRPNMIGDQIVVGNGQRITGYTLKLAPQSVIVGKVTDEFGEAVANAQAVLYRAEYARGSRRLGPLSMVQTDDLGKFRLSGMAPGSYYLAVMMQARGRAARRGPQPSVNEPETGYGMIWYPNAPDAAGASPIVVRAAAEVPIEIILRRIKVVRIRGTVVDPTGAPIERASVGLTPRGLGTATSIGNLRMMPGGAFEIANVPAGSYVLSARALNSGTATENNTPSRMAFLPVEVRDANLEDVKLQLTAGREVRGTVRWEGGGAQSAFLTASAAEGFSSSASVSPMNGAFALRSVWPLTYALDVGGLCPNCFVKSVRYGGRDVPEAGIDFSGDGELEMVVSASAASLDGVAADRQGRPAGGATVMLASADGTGRILSGKADARGAFHFGGLRPGAYRVYAWEGAAPEVSPEALAPFQAQASTVRLEESAREKLQIATIKR